MRAIIIIGLQLSLAFAAGRKDGAGVKTPGVQIPFAILKSDLTFDLAAPAAWIGVGDSIWIPSNDSVVPISPKAQENKSGTPIGGLKSPCGMVSAFDSLWVADCGERALVKIDAKGAKITATTATGTGTARPAIAANPDSVWMITDTKGTISRIDPRQNQVVAEFRVYPDCNTLAYGEDALWLTCPAENRVLRI